MFRKGQKVKVHRDNDNDGYDSFRNKILIVIGVYRNDKEHPGYDTAFKWVNNPDYN